MSDFEWGITLGKFFTSFIINDDFFGIGVRIGKEYAISENKNVCHVTIQIGYGQLTVGIVCE